MPITLTINGEDHTVDPAITAAELFASLHPEIAPDAVGYWLLAREDGLRYIENPQRKDTPVTALFEGEEGEEPVPLYLEQPPKCRHGSPAVRNRGFLCGWC